MARLIPSFTDDRTPPGERDVFNLLGRGPNDWTAIHSLDLAPWNRGLRTEIDFLLIVPDVGILCIEVKSHERITFENDRWYPAEIKRSPFKQACDASHTFHRRLNELAPRFTNVPVVHCCIFPRAQFDVPRNLSVQPWELIDSRTFHQFADAEALCAEIKSRMSRAIQADRGIHALDAPLSSEAVDTIVNCCVPVQRRRPDAREEIRRRESDVELLLREQQKPVLRLAELNSRLIVSGAAGTGKTLISMEVARRAAEKSRRVGLLCFNQLIGDWMKERCDRINPRLPNLIVGRAIRVVAEMLAITIPENPSPRYWDRELPDLIQERITDPEVRSCAAFDYLVLDEAQDLLATPWLCQSLGSFLNHGFQDGSYCILGDFENQVLGDRASMEEALRTLKSRGRPTSWHLSENCRNYRIVGESAVRLSGLNKSVYSGFLRSGGGIDNYDIFYYENPDEQVVKVVQWLNEFKVRGYRPSEVTLLSFCDPARAVAARLSIQGVKLRPAWQAGGLTSFTSVHAFKGLENKIVILTDVTLNESAFERYLFYVGMTRASEFVRIACNKSSQSQLLRWMTERE